MRIASLSTVGCRSRRKVYDKKKAGRTGVKKKIGSHLDESRARQCDRCDKNLHRRCEKLKHCTARQRSPPGINKRKQGEARAHARERAHRACTRSSHTLRTR